MLTTYYLTRNPCYKAGRTIRVQGLMLHSVGVPQPDPWVFVRNWNKESYDRACVHGFVGAEEAVITLPSLETPGVGHRGWHCGDKGNNTHLGFELCEPKGIRYTGGASFEVLDRDGATVFVTQTTRRAVELFARLCEFHSLDPLTDIVSHAEGHALGIASNHGDPDHLWAGLGLHYSMDAFRWDVAAAMTRQKEEMDLTREETQALIDEALARRDDFAADSAQKVSPWAAESWDKAVKAGILDGTRPGTALTREQAAVLLDRLGALKIQERDT